MENKKGSGIFLGVIGVATLLVAIIGATFAYFSATIIGTDQTIATGAELKLGFKDYQTGIKNNLIPSETYISQYAASDEAWLASGKECRDDNNNDVCSVYEFTIGNPSFTTVQNVYGTLNVSTNDLPDLRFEVYLVTETQVDDPEDDGTATITKRTLTRVIEPTDVPDTGDSIALSALNQPLLPSSSDAGSDGAAKAGFDETDPSTYTLVTGTAKNAEGVEVQAFNKRTYRLVVWIEESGSDQTEAHKAKTFAAGITFTSGTNRENGVTGVIATAQKPSQD